MSPSSDFSVDLSSLFDHRVPSPRLDFYFKIKWRLSLLGNVIWAAEHGAISSSCSSEDWEDEWECLWTGGQCVDRPNWPIYWTVSFTKAIYSRPFLDFYYKLNRLLYSTKTKWMPRISLFYKPCQSSRSKPSQKPCVSLVIAAKNTTVSALEKKDLLTSNQQADKKSDKSSQKFRREKEVNEELIFLNSCGLSSLHSILLEKKRETKSFIIRIHTMSSR